MRSAACRQTQSWLTEQQAPPGRRGRRPALGDPPPASSAIEVRTVIGRVPAALTAFRAALAPVRNLVLLLPSPDPEESVRVLTERRAPPLRYIAGTACWPGAGQQRTILAR